MKTYLLSFILFILASLQLSAANENDPVSMVSYEQGWLDYNGTIALKNNTQEDIHNVSFMVRYYDMNGTELDYREFNETVEIAPGMTKKLDIAAYEHSRQYSYYKSEGVPGNPHKFKIKYEMISYNVASSESVLTANEESNYGLSRTEKSQSDTWVGILAILLAFSIIIGVYYLIGSMAKSRNRSVVGYILIAIVTTPIIAIILLLCLGNKKD